MNAIDLAFRNAHQTRPSASTSQRAISHGVPPKVLLAVREHSTCVLVSRNLEQAGIDVVGRADNPAEIARITKATSAELLVIDDDLHRLTVGAARARQVAPLPALLLVSGDRDRIDDPTSCPLPAMGVVSAPFSARNLLPAIEIAYARYSELQRLREQAAKLRLRLDAREPIDHAKKLLMTHNRMDEDEAYRWLRRSAMDHRIPMASMAVAVVAELSYQA